MPFPQDALIPDEASLTLGDAAASSRHRDV
jgi:hypothetical protein